MAIKHGINLSITAENVAAELTNLAKDIDHWEGVLAEKANELQVIEAAHKVLKFQTEVQIRQDPITFGFPKLTETLVPTILGIQPAVIESEKKLIAAKNAVNEVKVVTIALDAKRSACKYLTELTTGKKPQ